MSANSKIEWCDHTFNIAWGCIESTAGCDHCYARTLAARYGFDVWGPGRERRTFGAEHWREPFKWDRAAAAAGERHRVFSSSMTDLWLNDPTIDREREKLWPLIEQTPHLDWLLLTKHAERIPWYLRVGAPFPNAWVGVSVEDNSAAWRVDRLRRVAAAVRFLSVEPMLGPIDKVDLTSIDWVIVGGESGPGARPMNPRWVRELRDRCVDAGIPFFFKQWGEFAPGQALDTEAFRRASVRSGTVLVNQGLHDQAFLFRAGKKGAGRILDGRTWDEFPKTAVPA